MTTTGADLQSVAVGGSVHEDVLNEIFMIDPVDLIYQDNAGSSGADNSNYSWMTEELAAVDPTAKRIDGSATTGNNHKTGIRVWNNSEIQTRVVEISDRAQNVSSIGVQNLMSDSVVKRQKELRRNYDSAFLSNQASVRDDGSTTAGETAGMQAWIVTNYVSVGGGSPAAGGFDDQSGLVAAATLGTKAALSEATLNGIVEQTYTAGGEPTQIVSTPGVIGQLAKYFTTDGSKAVLYSDVGKSEGGMRVKSSVAIWESQYLTFELVSSREMLTDTDAGAPLFGVDWDYWETASVQGYELKDLARSGLFSRKEISADKGTKCLNEKSSFCVADIDAALAMTE